MKQDRQFEGSCIAITGAAGNIGLSTAMRFAQEGASVALIDIKPDALQEALEKVVAVGARAKTYQCDVTNYAAVEETFDRVASDFANIDFLFNNAGYQGAFKPVSDYPVDDFETVIRVNLLGVFHVLRAVSRHMIKRKAGAIVNTASMAGVGGPPNMAAYGASKFAVVGLTQTAARDLAPYNIRVNAISPAFMGPGYMWERQVQLQAEAGSQYFSSDPQVVAQQMIGSVPMRRYGNIDEIPGAVAFLMSKDSSYITGVNIPIAGGILG